MDTPNNKPNNRLFAVIGALAAVALVSFGMLAGSLFSRPTTANAQAAGGNKSITVSGTGEVRVKPDMANLNFQIQVTGKTADEALAAYEKAAQALTDKLTAMGLAKADIIVQPASVNPSFDPTTGMPREDGTYTANATITAVVRDLEKLRDVASDGLKSEAGIGLSYIEYKLSDDTAARTEAMGKAIDNARSQADGVAAKLGLSVKEVTNVVVQGNYAIPMEYGKGGGMANSVAQDANFAQLGTRPDIVVNLSVQVSYNFE